MQHLIKIESLAATGKGVGRLKVGNYTRAIFVPNTCPGDVVWVQITSSHKKYYEGIARRFVESSPLRSKIGCKHYKKCGACNLLHIKYDYQVEEKAKIAQQIIKRNKINLNPNPVIIKSDKVFNYRYKAKVFITSNNSKIVCGFKKKKSSEVIEINDCRIIHPKILEIMKKINKSNLSISKTYKANIVVNYDNEEEVCLYLKTDDSISKFLSELPGITIVNHKNYKDVIYSYTYQSLTFFYNPRSFIQANLKLNAKLIDIIKENTLNDKVVVDLYAGNGNLSLGLNAKVILVEKDLDTLNMLKKNLEFNKKEAEIYAKNALEFEVPECDTIIIDPPRRGDGMPERILNKSRQIIYLACKLENCVKDIKYLINKGYALKKSYLIDMFPHTNNFEFIAILRKV